MKGFFVSEGKGLGAWKLTLCVFGSWCGNQLPSRRIHGCWDEKKKNGTLIEGVLRKDLSFAKMQSSG